MQADRDEEFRSYVASRSAALLRTAFLLTGDRGDAEDLLQEALARLAGAWHRVERQGAVDAYVRRTMVNLRTSRWRRRRVATVLTDTTALPAVVGVARVADPAAAVVERDALWTALLGLPPRMRAVLVLRFYEDLSEADAAGVLQCSVGTVKSQTSRALARLREQTPLEMTPC